MTSHVIKRRHMTRREVRDNKTKELSREQAAKKSQVTTKSGIRYEVLTDDDFEGRMGLH